MCRVCVDICFLIVGVAEGPSAKVASPKPVQKKKELVRRRSSDGFTVLLHCKSRLEKLYNQTLRTQVKLNVAYFIWVNLSFATQGKQYLIIVALCNRADHYIFAL